MDDETTITPNPAHPVELNKVVTKIQTESTALGAAADPESTWKNTSIRGLIALISVVSIAIVPALILLAIIFGRAQPDSTTISLLVGTIGLLANLAATYIGQKKTT